MDVAATHILVFQLEDVDRVAEQFGPGAAGAALADVAAAMDAQAAHLLGRHRPVDLPSSRRPGRWWRGFAMAGGGESVLVDAAEQAGSVAAATRAVGHQVLLSVFGGSTGARRPFSASVTALPASLPEDLDAWLDGVTLDPVCTRVDLAPDEGRAMETLITGEGLRTLLQPVVALPSARLVGYEALTRGPPGSSLEQADPLFGAAERFNLTLELESVCARRAVALASGLPRGCWLAVNAGLETLAAPGVLESLARPGIVLEVTEHLPLDRAREYSGLFQKARALGARLALDDAGCGFADAEAVRAIRPDIVKLCITVIRNANRSSAHLDEIARTVVEFRGLGADVLAEGVETSQQVEALIQAGATLAQGWFFGLPVPAGDVIG